ncbi:MAG: helix-turn-helix transcriptional regulator [Clostridia bacterium]|nr:helix-turn-helix transcriptional regulator [Clostridia bacterium]
MSNLNQSTLNNIIRGITKNPHVMPLHKVANAFGMTLAEFLDFEELNDFSFDEAERSE